MRKPNPNTLILLNALSTYARMVLCAGLALFNSRWILAALGQTDFGLYAVVAGIMGFLAFLTGSMTGSIQRHYAYAIGQGDPDIVNRWFNASLLLHAVFAVVIILIGLPFGWFMLNRVLQIPPERLAATRLVFLCTLVTVTVHILAVSFYSMFTARQRIFELSFYQLLHAILMFGFAYALLFAPGDRLLVYAAGVAAISIFMSFIQVVRCMAVFRECRPRKLPRRELRRVRQLLSFAGWNLFGALGWVGSNQGMAFLINVFSGPRVNASFGLANQVTAQMGGVSQGLFNAIVPEITASEGRGERERVISLSLRASKLSVLLVCILLVPVLLELDALLALWLQDVPPHMAALCRIALLAFLVDKATIGYMAGVTARGVIAGYQSTLGTILLLAPFIAWGLFALGAHVVWAVGVAFLFTRVVCSLGRVWWARRLLHAPVRLWVGAVPVRCGLAVAVPLAFVVSLQMLFPPSLVRLAASLGLGGGGLCLTGWAWGLDRAEREYLLRVARRGFDMARQALARRGEA